MIVLALLVLAMVLLAVARLRVNIERHDGAWHGHINVELARGELVAAVFGIIDRRFRGASTGGRVRMPKRDASSVLTRRHSSNLGAWGVALYGLANQGFARASRIPRPPGGEDSSAALRAVADVVVEQP